MGTFTSTSDRQSHSPAPFDLADGELVRLILESATDFAIFTMDPNGIVTSWTQGAARVLGYTSEEMLHQRADVIFPPEEGGADAAAEERRTALAQGRAEDERWQVRKDGSRFWASGLVMPLADATQGFVKILRDRSAQHAADERLSENEELFRALATNIPQLVFRSRVTGERTWPGPQWSIFSGLAFAESLKFGWLEAIHPEDRDATMDAWADARLTGHYYCEHRILRLEDSDYRWHQTRATPLDQSNRKCSEWVGSSADIHDLRTLKDQQQVLMAELQHRTRNLLAVVQSVARQTLRTSDSLGQFETEFESRLRTLSRVQGLLARVDYSDIDVQDLVDSELAAHGNGHGNQIFVAGPPAALASSSAQALALALHELVTNAVKHGALRQPGAKLSVTWTIKEQAGQHLVVLDWVESGVSMPDAGTQHRKGYGSELIEHALPYTLKAKTSLVFGPDGVWCQIAAPISRARKETKS